MTQENMDIQQTTDKQDEQIQTQIHIQDNDTQIQIQDSENENMTTQEDETHKEIVFASQPPAYAEAMKKQLINKEKKD